MLEVSIIQKLLFQSIYICNVILIYEIKFLNYVTSTDQFDKRINSSIYKTCIKMPISEIMCKVKQIEINNSIMDFHKILNASLQKLGFGGNLGKNLIMLSNV